MTPKLRIASNMAGLAQHAPTGMQVKTIAAGDGVWSRLRQYMDSDVVVISNPDKSTALLCSIAALFPKGPRVVYYDVLVPVAVGVWNSLKRDIYLRLVRRADLILTVHADTHGYQKLLRLDSDRFKYVGFKSNSWEDEETVRLSEKSMDDGSYVLACGRSYRDFATFVSAMAIAGVPAKILIPGGGDVKRHGSVLPAGPLPDNVVLITHDGTRSSWLATLIGAKIVVVPLRAQIAQPAGVSVYLEAMNLSRPVVVTEGPSSRLMLDETIAGVVPAADADALASEVRRLWGDSPLRGSRVMAARQYIQTLGGVERMTNAMLAAVLEVVGEKD